MTLPAGRQACGKQKAAKLGFTDYLEKPITLEKTEDVIEKYIPTPVVVIENFNFI
jgi:response regulator of citrate/malate metabolism